MFMEHKIPGTRKWIQEHHASGLNENINKYIKKRYKYISFYAFIFIPEEDLGYTLFR